MGGSIFSKTRPQNRPLEYLYEPKFHTQTTMPKFVEIPKEDPEVQTETIASWEEKFVAYQTLSEECRRDLPLRDFCKSQYRENQ